MTKDTERSGVLAPEAVWKCGAAGSGAAEETAAVGGQTASGAWAGTAHPVSAALTVMREMTVFANWH